MAHTGAHPVLPNVDSVGLDNNNGDTPYKWEAFDYDANNGDDCDDEQNESEDKDEDENVDKSDHESDIEKKDAKTSSILFV